MSTLETRIIGLNYASIFIQFFWWALENFFLQEWCFGYSRSSKVIDFGTNRKHVCDFLLVCHSNLGPILPSFRDIAGFALMNPPIFHPNFWGVLLDQINNVGVSPSRNLKLFSRELFLKCSNLCEKHTVPEHDRQTTSLAKPMSIVVN